MEEKDLETIELFIDENEEDSGVEAISLVEYPAIEENFVALSKHKVEFKAIDDEKRIVVGYALIPDKKIYRKRGDYEYNIVFSKETVQKASELYLKRLKINNTTLEHESFTSGVSVIESWVTEDMAKDKINLYGVEPILGGWAVKMKVYNDEVWQDVKDGKYMGFSIEGSNFTSEKVDYGRYVEEDEELASYSDYPESASNNAKRALKYKEENGSSCGTSVGWTRARQLANRQPISRKTIARMASFKRHQQHKDVPYSEGCGGLMYDAWGGSSGVNWAISKMKSLEKMSSQKSEDKDTIEKLIDLFK